MPSRQLTRLWLALLLATFFATLFASACKSSPGTRDSGARMGARSATPGPDTFTYASGSAGVFTVPAGFYVRSWWAHNTTSGGTVTITPSGPREYLPCWDAGYDAGETCLADAATCNPDDAGPDSGCICTPILQQRPCTDAGSAIVIPAGSFYGEGIPVLLGGPDELGEGTIFVFTGTDSYVVGMRPY